MSSLFHQEEQKRLLEHLKKQAPAIYAMHCAKKRNEINKELNELRNKYGFLKNKKEKTDEDIKRMKEIADDGGRLKEELSLYEFVS